MKSRMSKRGSMEATTAAMRDQFHVFGANQDIMQRHVDQLTSDIKIRLGSVNKQVVELKEGFATAELDISTPVRKVDSGPSRGGVSSGRQRGGAGMVSPGNRMRSGALGGSRGESLLLTPKQDRRGSNVSVLSVGSEVEYEDGGNRGGNFSQQPTPMRPGSGGGGGRARNASPFNPSANALINGRNRSRPSGLSSEVDTGSRK